MRVRETWNGWTWITADLVHVFVGFDAVACSRRSNPRPTEQQRLRELQSALGFFPKHRWRAET